LDKVLFAVLVTVSFSVLLGSQEAFSDTFTVNTDQSSYVEGDSIIVSGITLPIIPDTQVSITIFRSGNLVDIAQVNVAPDGAYSHSFIATGPLWQFSGTYIVRSFYGTSTIETSFDFEGPQGPPSPDDPPENPTVTVMTDRNCYTVGDSITISGEALPPTTTTVSITIFHEGNLVDIAQVVAQDGNYAHTFIAKGPLWDEEGTYVVRSFYAIVIMETSFELFFDECPIVVGGELIPIKTTSLLLANAQTFSWMIPVVLSVLGIGLFVVSRKSENS